MSAEPPAAPPRNEPDSREWWQSIAQKLAIQLHEANLMIETRDATLAMAVARLRGTVEGLPTHRGNFIQRIDALVQSEAVFTKHEHSRIPTIVTRYGQDALGTYSTPDGEWVKYAEVEALARERDRFRRERDRWYAEVLRLWVKFGVKGPTDEC